MKSIKLSSVLFVILSFLTGCRPKSLLTIIINEFEANSDRTYNTKRSMTFSYFNRQYLGIYDKGNEQKRVYGRLVGKKYGHRFNFDNQDLLNRYIFDLDDGNHYSYGIELSKSNYLETGYPCVDRSIERSYKSKDSVLQIFFFTTFPRAKVKAFYSYNSTTFTPMELKESPVMPYLKEARIVLPKTLKSINLKVEAEGLIYSLTGLQEKRLFFETEAL